MTLTRYVHGAESTPEVSSPQAPYENTRVVGGSLSYASGFSEAPSRSDFASHTVSHDGTPGGSVMATRQTVGGRETVELLPGVPGSRTLITEALKAGLIEEHLPGRYRDASPENQQQATQQLTEQGEEQQQAQEDPGRGAFDAREDQEWAEAIDPIPQYAYDSALASAVAVIAHGQGSFEEAAKPLAQASGMEPGEALEYFQAGFAMYRGAVARGLEPLGLTGDRLEAFFDSTRESPQKLQDAIQRVYQGRDVGGFKAMAAEWVSKNPGPEVHVLKAAGFETYTDRETGEVMARQGQGQWVAASQLLKA